MSWHPGRKAALFLLGAAGRIVFIAPKFHDRMDRLAALGVIPGSELRLHQRSPSYVIEVGETTIALDAEIAGEIFVKPVDAADPDRSDPDRKFRRSSGGPWGGP